jgi:hypothetical protein
MYSPEILFFAGATASMSVRKGPKRGSYRTAVVDLRRSAALDFLVLWCSLRRLREAAAGLRAHKPIHNTKGQDDGCCCENVQRLNFLKI